MSPTTPIGYYPFVPIATLAPSPTTPREPDWLLAPVLYAQGVATSQIAARIGVSHDCLRQRALRQGWSRLRNELAHTASQATEHVIDKVLNGHSSDTRKALGAAIAQHVALIPKAKGWKHVAKLQSDLEPLIRNARTVYGWGDGDASGGVQIRSIRNAVIVTSAALDAGALHDASTASEQSAHASIDAECVPSPPAPEAK